MFELCRVVPDGRSDLCNQLNGLASLNYWTKRSLNSMSIIAVLVIGLFVPLFHFYFISYSTPIPII